MMLRRILAPIAEAALGLIGMAALAAWALGWRLAQRPLDVGWLAQREQASLALHGAKLSVGGAVLAWNGFYAADQPLDIRATDVTVTRPDGSTLLRVGGAQATLAPGPLLLGRVEPRDVVLQGPAIELRRDRTGGVQLDLPRAGAGASPGQAPGDWQRQFARLRISGGRLIVHDEALGLVWRAPRVELDLRRLADRGLAGSADLALEAGDARTTLKMTVARREGFAHVSATLAPVTPAVLARASPALAALAALEAPVQVAAEADLAGLAPRAVRVTVHVGEGRLLAGAGAVAVQAADAELSGGGEAVRLESLRLAFAPVPGGHGRPPVLTGQAEAGRRGAGLGGAFSAEIAYLDMGDLALYWPPGAGGGSRGWLVQNILAGEAHGAHVSGTLEAPLDLSDATLTSLSGGMDADGLEVTWLKPIPPITGGAAHLDVEGPDALRIQLRGGAQGALRITDGMVRITGLSGRHQSGDIGIGIEGPLTDALALLDHKRLKLLSKRKLDLGEASGAVRARLSVKLPLENKVDMEDIAISAHATLADVHLAHPAAGRALDQAQLALDVDGDGLKLGGAGLFAGIPSTLALDMDFRAGAPAQVLEHLVATGKADLAGLVAAGLPAGAAGMLTAGRVGVGVDYASRRDGSGGVLLSADLGEAALATPLGWGKTLGAPASASAHLRLRQGSIEGIDAIEAHGPALALASHAQMEEGRLTGLVLDRVELGRTRARGSVAFPLDNEGSIDVTLDGPMLDLSPVLKPGKARAGPQGARDAAVATTPAPGRRWAAKLAFDRVLLTGQAAVGPLDAQAVFDGVRYASGKLNAGGPSGFSAALAPGAAGRHLTVDAQDAGPVLAALGVAENLRGGSLSVDALYDDARPGSPLAGTARLSEFNVADAPAVGRLLQAMTLYGLADLLRGPGLHFSRMVAPFRWEQRVLHLEGARAFSSSLGLTAQGDIDLRRHTANVQGTVVPAYFFNQLPGKLPLVGRLFSPERGGGVFAARYSVRGPLADPKVGVNPLSALTPGFLRGLFGLFAAK